MAILNAYDSKLTKLINKEELALEIKKAGLTENFYVEYKGYPTIINGMDVQPFVHPLYNEVEDCVYLDGRTFLKFNRQGGAMVTNLIDHQLMETRSFLEKAWVIDKTKDKMWSALSWSNSVYIEWFTSLIRNKLGLGIAEEAKMRALVCVYVVGQFYNTLNETTLTRTATLLARNNAVPQNYLQQILAELNGDYPRDIDEFTEAVRNCNFGPSARQFETKDVYQILNGSWHSNTEQKAIVALACEYPPAFASLVYLATQNTMFKKTYIGRAVYSDDRNNNFKNFKRMIDLIKESVTED